MKRKAERKRQKLQQCLARGNWLEAAKLCEELLGKNRGDTEVWLLLIQLYFNGGQADRLEQTRQHLSREFPADTALHRQLARFYQRIGDIDIAMDEYEKAVAACGVEAEPVLEYAALLMMARRYDRCIELLETLTGTGRAPGRACLMLGAAYQSVQDIDRACIQYRRAHELDGTDPEARTGLAGIALLRRDHDKASSLLEPVLAMEQPPIAAILTFAQLAATVQRGPEAIALIEHALQRPGLSTRDRSMLHFALGRLLDEAEDPAGAFASYRRGNELDRPLYDRKAIEAAFGHIMERFSGEALTRAPVSGQDGGRLIFIVGMPRSGTSLTEQILAAHPEVYGAGELPTLGASVHGLREKQGLASDFPHYLPELSGEILDSAALQYLNHVSRLDTQAARVTDKMPDNFLYLGMISLLFPGARIIHCTRHPLDTCLSCYFQQFSGHYPYAYDLGALGHYYRQYRALMTHWREVLALPMLEVSYEALVQDTQGTVAGMLEFCGLEWDDRCLRHDRSQRAVTTASSQQAGRPIYKDSVNRWKRYEPWLGELIGELGTR